MRDRVSGISVGMFVLALASLSLMEAEASQGESYWTVGGGYLARVTNPANDAVHGAHLFGGIGWFPSDFTVGEVTGHYGLGYLGGLHNFFALQAHFRVLIDAFEWVPSIGPVVGLTTYTAPFRDFGAVVDLGVEGCVAWRGSRESSWKVCGVATVVPTVEEYETLFTISVGYDRFFSRE